MAVKKDGTERKKREMTPELLEKLALARAKALEVKRAEKEGGNEAKLANLQKRMDKLKSKGAGPSKHTSLPPKIVEEDEEVVDKTDKELTEESSIKSPEPRRVSTKKKGKKPIVIVRQEESDSDEEEEQQVIYIKDRKPKIDRSLPPPGPVYQQSKPPSPPPPPKTVVPNERSDKRMNPQMMQHPIAHRTIPQAPKQVSASHIMRGGFSTG